MVQENHCSWSKRLRLYNQFVQGNAELLSISSDDSIWNSDDEESSKKPHQRSRNTEDTDENTADTVSKEQESIQYKKTMMQRYLNDALEATTEKPQVGPESTSTANTTTASSTYPTTTPSTYSRMYWPPAPPTMPLPMPGMFPWLPLPPLLNSTTNGNLNFGALIVQYISLVLLQV